MALHQELQGLSFAFYEVKNPDEEAKVRNRQLAVSQEVTELCRSISIVLILGGIFLAFNFFNRLKEGLSKTRDGFTDKVEAILKGNRKIDDELLDELEEVLITADIGIQRTVEIMESLKANVAKQEIKDSNDVYNMLKEELTKALRGSETSLNLQRDLTVILVVGVNGVGKTTTIGKLGLYLKEKGSKVIFAAGDTFRAAAIDQLKIWGERNDIDVVYHHEGSDPAAVVFDALQAAKARKCDVLIIDTAGRLHTKANLMEELKKIKRVVEKEISGAPHEVLLVLDATTGQNALAQAKTFNEAVNLTGIVLTKLDGTAKGGIAIGINSELGIPIKFIGIGEKVSDLQEFHPDAFISAIFD
jgi:fused signal recognition particle receptor